MGDNTNIEWTDATWNPVRGCALVSAGCTNCYAMRQAHRSSGAGGAYEGLTKSTSHGPVWTGAVRLVPELLDQPLQWRRPRRIFVNSMSDLFHEDVPDEFILDVFACMALAHQHTFQILTKRPARMRLLMAEIASVGVGAKALPLYQYIATRPNASSQSFGIGGQEWLVRAERIQEVWPLPNVWLGVSVENQETADERIPLLLQTPAAVRWISAEPLLGRINVRPYMRDFVADDEDATHIQQSDIGVDWIVAGGESGPNARPAHPDWFRELRDVCADVNLPFFFKQWGEWLPVKSFITTEPQFAREFAYLSCDGKIQSNRLDWEYLVGDEPIVRVGKKAAGNLLDGRTHLEYPQ